MMYNNTQTESVHYINSSSLQETDERKENEVAKMTKYPVSSIFDDGSSFSIVLKKIEIIKELSCYFDIENSDSEIEFLSENLNIYKLLPSIGLYIKHNLDPNSKLTIELMSEGEDWQTLFININSNSDWEVVDSFINKFFDDLYGIFPNVADRLNINFIPDEF